MDSPPQSLAAIPQSEPSRVSATRDRNWVLITGGAGFIGTNLASRFLQAGKRVLIYDNLSRAGVQRNLDWLSERYGGLLEIKIADVLDQGPLNAAAARASMVFHFAAQVAVTTSLIDPRQDFEVNAMGTLNVLEACRRRASPPPLLFTSTNKVYGALDDLKLVLQAGRYRPINPAAQAQGVDESRPLDFHSPYGCSKGTADQYVRDYARCYGVPTVVFRMSCIYGPHQHGTEEQGWVAHFARAMLHDEPLNIYGDGGQVRDLLFVDDLTRAMQMSLEQIGKTRGQVFNMGGGPANAVSVSEVIHQLARLRDESPEIRYGAWRQGDQKWYVSDSRKLQRAIGWRPLTDVPAGLRRLHEWLSRDQEQAASSEPLGSAVAGKR